MLGQLRERDVDVPVLILSARGRTADKVDAFRLGTDDYVTKPFQLPELIARVQGMLRRRRPRLARPPRVFGDIELDEAARTVRRAGREVELLAKEFDLLCLLARNPGRIAIYGWHRPDGRPIQPLSTVHGADYADYSHGIRLVSEVAVVDGEPESLYRVLQDPARAAVLSD